MTRAHIPARDRVFGGEDRDLYLHVGYFQTWFASCERQITYMLARATGFKNFDSLKSFQILARGMDARVKIERLRQACEGRFPIGPNLDQRLGVFSKTLVSTRNKLAHSSLAHPPPSDRLYMTTIVDMPSFSGEEAGFGNPSWITFDDLFYQALWMNLFTDDMQAITVAGVTPTFEIANPRSPPRPEAR